MNIYKDCIVSIKKIQLCKNEIIYNIYEILYKKDWCQTKGLVLLSKLIEIPT